MGSFQFYKMHNKVFRNLGPAGKKRTHFVCGLQVTSINIATLGHFFTFLVVFFSYFSVIGCHFLAFVNIIGYALPVVVFVWR